MAELDENQISVRFKHGVHTIFLFIDSTAPMSVVTTELFELLRDRYPQGLTTSTSPPKTTPLPSDGQIAYAVLNVPTDPTKGWERLNVGYGQKQTPKKLNLKENSVVAFTFVDKDEDGDEEVAFEVEWPRDEEEYYETNDS